MSESITAAGQGITEALGGFWTATNGVEPTFVPLDEFISKKFLEDVEGDMQSHELVLEAEL